MIFTVFLDRGMSIAKAIFKSTLSFLEMSFTCTTGPLGLQRHHRQQSPLQPGLHSPALRLSAPEDSRVCSP